MVVIFHLVRVAVIVAVERVDGLLAEPCCDILFADLLVGGDRGEGSGCGRGLVVDDHGGGCSC